MVILVKAGVILAMRVETQGAKGPLDLALPLFRLPLRRFGWVDRGGMRGKDLVLIGGRTAEPMHDLLLPLGQVLEFGVRASVATGGYTGRCFHIGSVLCF